MSLSLFNKLVDIVNTDNNDTIKGGMLMTNTIDNLVGGNTVSNTCDDKNVITKEFNPNLFEGGVAHTVDIPSESFNDNKPSYSSFLQRLSTNKLYTTAEQTAIGGGSSSSNAMVDGEQSAGTTSNAASGTIDVLPMFPYLVRYT